MLGETARHYLNLFDRHLPLDCLKRRYTFVGNEEFGRINHADPSRGQQIYWSEMVMRSHMAAATAILRSRRWTDAVLTAALSKNLLAFAAALRGLIESAADVSDALMPIPRTLARDRARINEALSGRSKVVFLVEGLEDLLIHYAYARKLDKGQSAPKSHKVRLVRDYIQILEKGQVPRVVECYGKLCDLTHPGASSVHMWLAAKSDLELELETDGDAGQIGWLLAEYEQMFPKLLMFAFNLPIVTLAVLNYLDLPEFHTPELKGWNLSGIGMWRDVEKELRPSH
jgi:hypothetical protein